MRLLPTVQLLPLVEAGGWQDAALIAHGVAKRGLLSGALRPRVEEVRFERGGVLHPVGHQAPAHGAHLAAAVSSLPDHGYVLGWCDVEALRQRIGLDFEERSQVVLMAVQRIATAHGHSSPLLG